MDAIIEGFERKFDEAKKEYNSLGELMIELGYKDTGTRKKEYDLLGELIVELGNTDTGTLKETIKKVNKMNLIIRKRMKLRAQQLERDKEEMKYRRENGLPPLTKLRELQEYENDDE